MYPESFREEALLLARERRALGVPVARIATELGLKSRTLALWLRRRPRRAASERVGAPKRRLRRVELAEVSAPSADSPRSTLWVSVGAVRIEGLDFESVLRLVRALSS